MTASVAPGVSLFTLREQEERKAPPPRLRLIIAGSRGLAPPSHRITEVIAAWLPSTSTVIEVVSGHAPGVDRCGEAWARACRVPVRLFPARWREHGRAAGCVRNAEMIAYADALLAFWDGVSPGTRDVIARARALGKPLHVVEG